MTPVFYFANFVEKCENISKNVKILIITYKIYKFW